jgi:hypothetical protein
MVVQDPTDLRQWCQPEIVRSFTEEELEEEMRNSNLQVRGHSQFSNKLWRLYKDESHLDGHPNTITGVRG